MARSPGWEVLSGLTLADRDPEARNTLGDPERVAPAASDTVVLDDGLLGVKLPAVSWTVITLSPGHHA